MSEHWLSRAQIAGRSNEDWIQRVCICNPTSELNGDEALRLPSTSFSFRLRNSHPSALHIRTPNLTGNPQPLSCTHVGRVNIPQHHQPQNSSTGVIHKVGTLRIIAFLANSPTLYVRVRFWHEKRKNTKETAMQVRV